MATTIREAISLKYFELTAELRELQEAQECLPAELVDLEADSITFLTSGSFTLVDESHPGLCAGLMEIGFVPISDGRKRAARKGMRVGFYLKRDDDYTFVDVVRPSRNCKQVKVRVTEERVIELCGDLPSNYELLEVIGE